MDHVLTILGSGTLLPDHRRHGPAHHLRLGGASLLLDCGPGTLDGFSRYHVEWSDLSHIVLTHFHNDHVGDLGALLFALKHGARPPREAPLRVLGPTGTRDFMERLAGALGDHVLDPGFPLHVGELTPGAPFRGEDWSVAVFPTPHTEESVAVRVTTGRGDVGYTGDTGPSPEVASFLRDCAVVIAECAFPDPPPFPGHLTPSALGEMASVMRPDTLVLTHVYPLHTPEEAGRGVSESGYEGVVIPGEDGMTLRF
ncbi:MAG: MBL fold metallo-hydrolase [Gemmatimonadota bacterium]